MSEVVGFYAEMDLLGPWEPVPILVTMCGGGAVEHDFFETTIASVQLKLAEVGRVDGVYICNHGPMVTTGEEDGDGVFFAAVRDNKRVFA